MSGRGISEENIWNVKQNLTRLYAKQVRISGQIKELTLLLGEHEPDAKCWSCVYSNRESTALLLCELENTLYPVACNEFESK